ncbi:LPS export ABC transporter permease LptF [Candidatus Methylomicrobium oryzae]|uniref:LPS export ABC transporter permease LptF n=1 Tax=Candidatus Methylomicrobium oryzae TaxID=2802053 RepID=UPI001923DA52|nr:LPS export ABC transporter permease LptF [Methylomicrobium sp. RS1]MBL1262836.1 LPS export ABC transporter permease LptF [Methylomicrobium sp. RS1]
MIEETRLEANWPQGTYAARKPLFGVLDRMIATDLFKTMLSVWSVIVVIIVSRKFIKVLDQAIAGEISNDVLLTILGLRTIIAGVTFLPAATFMAVLMVLGRMYRDQEMSALQSAGAGAGAIYRSVFQFVVPLSLAAAGLSLYVAPWAEATTEQLISKDRQSADIRGIAPGKFSEYSGGDLVFYVEDIGKDKTMHKVFVQHRQKSGSLAVVNAETGRLEDLPDGRYIVLQQGERIQGQPGELDYVIEEFNQYAVRIDGKEAFVRELREALPSERLWNSDKPPETAELQRRLGIPFGALLLSFIAVPLAQLSPRGGVYGNILTGFLIFFIYGNLERVSQGWVTKAVIPPWLGPASVYGLLLAIGLVYLARFFGWKWLMLKVKASRTQ